MTHHEKMEKMEAIFNKALSTAHAKGLDYSGEQDGMGNLKDFGAMGIVARIGDKYNRLKNIFSSGAIHVQDESILDTLEDLINYAALCIIQYKDETQSKEV